MPTDTPMTSAATYSSCPCDRPTCAGDNAIASIGCVVCGSYSHLTDEHDQYEADHAD